MSTDHNSGELRRSAWSPVILAAAAHCPRRRAILLRIALRLEGGDFYSYTGRSILSRHYDVDIGPYSYGGCFVPGAVQPNVSIGRYVSVGPQLLIYRRDHPVGEISMHPFLYNSSLGYVRSESIPFRPLEVAADAWIGARVFVTAQCSRIGIGAVIAAGAVVTRDVPDFAIVAGVPARVVRMRFPATQCQEILASRWWELPVMSALPVLQGWRAGDHADAALAH